MKPTKTNPREEIKQDNEMGGDQGRAEEDGGQQRPLQRVRPME